MVKEAPQISVERLQAILANAYDLRPATIEYLPFGSDYHGGVYHVTTETGLSYLLKATTRPLYQPRYIVPRFLHDQGITAVVAPIPTTSGALWAPTQQDGVEWTIIVYPWIAGDSSLAGMTDAQWRELGGIFRWIHQTPAPPELGSGISGIRRETFDPSGYIEWIERFEAESLRATEDASASSREVRALWMQHQSTIHAAIASLDTLGRELRARHLPHVICHADLHPANLIRTPDGKVYVIDWDDVMLAPKERDFIFIREPAANAFWEGYGQGDIDWPALTYFLWERTVQDLIECATDVRFRDDLGEETKVEIAGLFRRILTEPDGSLAWANDAASHLT